LYRLIEKRDLFYFFFRQVDIEFDSSIVLGEVSLQVASQVSLGNFDLLYDIGDVKHRGHGLDCWIAIAGEEAQQEVGV
jgi:hypothetical protein